MEDLISVIVPVYKAEKYIHKCIDSIINQTYTNLEIILVDDGSPDNCGKICDEYAQKDKRVKVIHKENGGVSSARNAGIKNAKGEWFSFVDADDWIEKGFCEILLSKVVQNQSNIALCGYNRVTDNSVEKINASNKDLFFNSSEYLIKSLNPQTGFGFCHMKLIKKEVLNNIFFDENIVVGEDALFNIMLSTNINKAIFVEQALYNYRINNQSVVKKYDKNYANKYLIAMQVIKKYLIEKYNDSEIQQNYYNFVAYHILLIAVNYCYHLDNKGTNNRKLLREICNYDEFKIGLKKCNYNNLSITRKITLFTIKHKLYWISEFICKYRQKQNNTGEKK